MIPYSGFVYRLFQRYTDVPTSQIDISCPRPVDHSQSLLPTCPHVVVTYCNRVFYETAIGLVQAIERSLPFVHAVVWPDLNLALLDVNCPSPLQIALAPHEETPLLTHYIVFQMEQTWSDYMEDQRFQTILKKSASVWTFSRQQYQLLSQIGVPIANLRNLPLYTDRRYSENTLQLLQSGSLHSLPKRVDVLFFGSTSPRRHKFLTELQEFGSSNSLQLGGILGGAEINLLRGQRDQLVRSSKVMLPIQQMSSSFHRLFSMSTLKTHLPWRFIA